MKINANECKNDFWEMKKMTDKRSVFLYNIKKVERNLKN